MLEVCILNPPLGKLAPKYQQFQIYMWPPRGTLHPPTLC